MATKSTKVAGGSTKLAAQGNSIAIASRGIFSSEDFAKLMSAMMADLAAGRMATHTANAMCNAGGKLLKVVEMQFRYGTRAKKRESLGLVRK